MSITAEEWSSIAGEPIDMQEMDALVRRSVSAWNLYDIKNEDVKQARKQAEELDAQIMENLKRAGKSKYFVDGVGTVSRVARLAVRVPKTLESKREFFKFLIAQSKGLYYSLVTVNSNSLTSWYNEEAKLAAEKGISGFSVPGLEQPVANETLRFVKDKNYGKE